MHRLVNDEIEDIGRLAHDFQILQGRVTEAENENDAKIYSVTPFTLLPTVISRKHFHQGRTLQTKFQVSICLFD